MFQADDDNAVNKVVVVDSLQLSKSIKRRHHHQHGLHDISVKNNSNRNIKQKQQRHKRQRSKRHDLNENEKISNINIENENMELNTQRQNELQKQHHHHRSHQHKLHRHDEKHHHHHQQPHHAQHESHSTPTLEIGHDYVTEVSKISSPTWQDTSNNNKYKHFDTVTHEEAIDSTADYPISAINEPLPLKQMNGDNDNSDFVSHSLAKLPTFQNESALGADNSVSFTHSGSLLDVMPKSVADGNEIDFILTVIGEIDEKMWVLLIVMAICALVYSVLLCILSKPAMNEIFLVLVSYVIVGTFVAIQIAVGYSTLPSKSFNGCACCVIFVYMTYTMLPLRQRESLVGGIILSATQIYTSISHVEDTYQWQELFSTLMALFLSNLTGIYTHWPKEKAQRKAFIETRQCIEARLRTQRENQQQERLLLSVLPRHVAMEMKDDIAGQPRDTQFHKIYIQRHENV
ncbi:uncharacterized protein LOC133338556, partial [Musca vetustissima]|uniref:uncharacterized protein LOC133338556 n=1 Tax=Musca vetustissima TaxID=27455 RepID=UPI002AB6025F